MSKEKLDEYGNPIQKEVNLEGSPHAGSDQSEVDSESELHEGPKLSEQDLEALRDIQYGDLNTGSSSQSTPQAEEQLSDEQQAFVDDVRRSVNASHWKKQGQSFFSKVWEKTTGKETDIGNKTPDHITQLKDAVKYPDLPAYRLIKIVVDNLKREDLEARRDPQKSFYKNLIEKFEELEKPSLGKKI